MQEVKQQTPYGDGDRRGLVCPQCGAVLVCESVNDRHYSGSVSDYACACAGGHWRLTVAYTEALWQWVKP